MKPTKLVLAILLAVAAVVFWYLGRPPAPRGGAGQEGPAPSAPRGKESPAASGPASGPTATTTVVPGIPAQAGAVAPAASPGEDPVEPPAAPAPPVEAGAALEPGQKLESLRLTFRTYGQRFLGNPVGNNAEITAALQGGNPKGVNFLGDGVHRLNGRGELCDDWGTPYFFHQLSGTEMEIHSAGPDRKMGTGDDLVVK